MTRPINVPVSLTVSRTPAHWLILTKQPFPHLRSACDVEGSVYVLPKAMSRRRYRPDLLVCRVCQDLLDSFFAHLLGAENELFDGPETPGPDTAGQ